MQHWLKSKTTCLEIKQWILKKWPSTARQNYRKSRITFILRVFGFLFNSLWSIKKTFNLSYLNSGLLHFFTILIWFYLVFYFLVCFNSLLFILSFSLFCFSIFLIYLIIFVVNATSFYFSAIFIYFIVHLFHLYFLIFLYFINLSLMC